MHERRWLRKAFKVVEMTVRNPLSTLVSTLGFEGADEGAEPDLCLSEAKINTSRNRLGSSEGGF